MSQLKAVDRALEHLAGSNVTVHNQLNKIKSSQDCHVAGRQQIKTHRGVDNIDKLKLN